MAIDFTLRQLMYFVAAADAGTTQAAADTVFVSQSTMSAALADLESTLHAQLFVRRKGKGLSLTESGRSLLPLARRLLAEATDLQAVARDLQAEMRGPLIVGCFEIIAPSLLPRLLQGFLEEYPSIEIDFIEGSHAEMIDALMSGRIEVAILLDGLEQSQLDRAVLAVPTPHILVSSDHRLADADSVALAEIQDEPLIFVDAEPSQEFTMRSFRLAGATPNIRFRSRNIAHMQALVRRGLGYALVVQGSRTGGLAGHGVSAVPLRDDIPSDAIVIAHPAGVRLTRRALTFWEFAIAHSRAQVVDG